MFYSLWTMSLFIFLSTFSINVSASVSEETVKKWDNKMLCEKQWVYRRSRSSTSLERVNAEIARRPELDINDCLYSLNRVTETNNTVESSNTAIEKVFAQTFAKYGEDILTGSIYSYCGKESAVNDTIIQAQNYARSLMAKPSLMEFRYMVTERFPSIARGFVFGFITLGANAENCTELELAKMEDKITAIVGRYVEPKTSQNITEELPIGITSKQVIDRIGASRIKKKIGAIEEVIYCSTGSQDDEFLALYFFKEKLIAQSMYKVNKIESNGARDCTEAAYENGYKRPALVNLLTDDPLPLEVDPRIESSENQTTGFLVIDSKISGTSTIQPTWIGLKNEKEIVHVSATDIVVEIPAGKYKLDHIDLKRKIRRDEKTGLLDDVINLNIEAGKVYIVGHIKINGQSKRLHSNVTIGDKAALLEKACLTHPGVFEKYPISSLDNKESTYVSCAI